MHETESVMQSEAPGRMEHRGLLLPSVGLSNLHSVASGRHGHDYFGSTTVSITWITPFDARMSVFTTLALSIDTTPPFVEIVSD